MPTFHGRGLRACVLPLLLCAPFAAAQSPLAAPASPAPSPIQASDLSRTRLAVLAFHNIPPQAEEKSDGYSVPLDLFKQDIQAFADSGWTFVSMAQIEAFYRQGKPLPDRAVHVTFDDGYKTTVLYAGPWLREKGIPFTVFPYVTMIESGKRSAMTWDDLKTIVSQGGEIGCHSFDHPILTKPSPEVSKSPEKYAAWLEREAAKAKEIIEAHLGSRDYAYAFPFGMANTQALEAVSRAGFTLAFNILGGENCSATDPLGLYRVLGLPSYTPAALVAAASVHPLPVRIVEPGIYSVLPDGKVKFKIKLDPEMEGRYGELSLKSASGPLGNAKVGDFAPAGAGLYELEADLPKTGWYVMRLQGIDRETGAKGIAMMLLDRPSVEAPVRAP